MSLRLPFIILLCLAVLPAQAANTWQGRKLSEVLNELRAAGLPLLYSSQVVDDNLVIKHEPDAKLQLERLKLALREHSLALQSLPAGQGYAIVRQKVAQPNAAAAPPTSVDVGLAEVIVFASHYDVTRDEPTSSAQLAQGSLQTTAGVEQDVLRSVQYLPGTTSNVSALTHVRGGYLDENLVRFDGVQLYNPVHLKDFQGLFGLLDPDWAQSLTFYSGAYPVRYGNHNSSVMDIAARTITAPEYMVGLSVLYSDAFSVGSYNDQAGHWLLGYRRSNLPTLVRHADTNIGEPEFEDLVLRHAYRFEAGELRVGMLRLNDDLQLQAARGEQRAHARNNDLYLWSGWRQQVSDALDFNLQLSHAQLATTRTAVLQRDNIVNGNLDDHRDTLFYTFDGELNWQASPQTQWQWGARINHGRANYAYLSQAAYFAPLSITFNQPANIMRTFAQRFSETDSASWVSINHVYDQWRAELGLRYDHVGYVAHGSQLSPRLNLQYAWDATRSLHFSIGDYAQAQSLDQLDNTVSTPRFYPMQHMRQLIVGFNQALNSNLQLRIEAYEKRGSRLRPRAENLLSFITLAGELEIDRAINNAARSRAQGVELSLNAKLDDQFGWWLNYAWSRAQDRLDGAYVARAWDQPHALTAGTHWRSHRWLLSASASWHSGFSYTPLIISADGNTATLGARNSQRFSDFASLELRAEYTLPVRSSELKLFIELRNALDRENLCCRELRVTTNNGTSVITVKNEDTLGLIPIAGFNFKF